MDSCDIGERLSASMLAWRHSGFSVHNGVGGRAGDGEGRKKVAQYMLRAPFSLEKMTYLPETGMVMYRSHLHKSLKRTPVDARRAMARNALPARAGSL